MHKVLVKVLVLGFLVSAGVLAIASRRGSTDGSGDGSAVGVAVTSARSSHVYWTWSTMELDKCAAAWLIRRFLHPEAVFRFYPKDTTGKPGTPFDIPGAAWSRQPGKCGTEAVLESLDIDDPAVAKIAGFARVAELARWQLDAYPEAREHYLNVRAIIDAHPVPEEAFEHVSHYLDELYERLSSPAPDGGPASEAVSASHNSE